MSVKSKNYLDILAIAPHPDDAEVWCGGYLAKAVKQGYQVGVLDLTKGELSSNGNLSTRAKETLRASKILNLSYRDNLKIPDGEIEAASKSQLVSLVNKIRATKPKLILAPYFIERHPDHEAASKLVERAVFFAGLRKFSAEAKETHTIQTLIYYQLRVGFKPSFLVDVSDVYQTKLEAIKAYTSQLFSKEAHKTLISDPGTLKAITTRDAFFGSQLGVEYAECYFTTRAISLSDPVKDLSSKKQIHFYHS